MKRALTDYAGLAGKRVLVRTDCDVPLKDGRITDDSRLRVALPTLEYLLDRNARVILCTHLGDPNGRIVDSLRRAKTIVWNGPLGGPALDEFAGGTRWLVETMAHADAVTVVGGDDTVPFVTRTGLAGLFSHVSFGGESFVAFLQDKQLPAVAALPDAAEA
jgi:3-phosphoglycerate kinase